MTLPPGRTPHSSYPFGLHDHLHDPWDYSVTNGILVLHSRKCTRGVTLDSMGHCQYCEMLAKDANIQGILRRMEIGVLENAILAYHSIGSLMMLARWKQGEIKTLRLHKLNDSAKLARRAVALDDYKKWVMAVGSGKVELVDRLVRINLTQKGSISHLLDLYEHAAKQTYHPQNYTEKDELCGLLLWWLGGAQIAGITHHALKLPSLSML